MFSSYKQSKSRFCKMITDRDQQKKCQGCQDIAGLLRSPRENRWCQFHNDYQELSECAKKGCVSCRVFRRAPLLNQITTLGAKGLDNAGKVWAGLPKSANQSTNRPGTLTLQICVRNVGKESRATANVFCMTDRNREVLNLNLKTPFREMSMWLRHCHCNHTACKNLMQTKTNPSKLIKIRSGGLQLVDMTEQDPVEYAALSYEWFGRMRANDRDRNRIEGNQTNSENIDKRRKLFPMADLSSTIQDALLLTDRLGLKYLWVDSICIPKGSDWNDEGSKMHLIYGNAYVTLCTCSRERAVDGLLHEREAWRYPNTACRLAEKWLYTEDMSMNEVRARAPLFTRGWVLQEERLSPRVLYLCGQRAYWSCFEAQYTEMGVGVGPGRQPLESSRSSYEWIQPPQLFLETRRQCKINDLHEQWLDMVRDYVSRGLHHPSDRFDAISGLAVQYLMAYSDSDSNEVKDEEYLAGLWRNSFSKDLAWSVANPKPLDCRVTVAPTWSWASLPLYSESIMPQGFSADSGDPGQLRLLTIPQLRNRGQISKPLDVVRRGALVKSIQVEGLFRWFVSKRSELIDWSEIQVPGRKDAYDFSNYLSTSVHCINPEDGRVLFYEPGKVEIVGQLDYSNPGQIDLGSLCCLRLSKESMLLLELAPPKEAALSAGLPVYQRVGVCNSYRENFFWHAGSKQITLV